MQLNKKSTIQLVEKCAAQYKQCSIHYASALQFEDYAKHVLAVATFNKTNCYVTLYNTLRIQDTLVREYFTAFFNAVVADTKLYNKIAYKLI